MISVTGIESVSAFWKSSSKRSSSALARAARRRTARRSASCRPAVLPTRGLIGSICFVVRGLVVAGQLEVHEHRAAVGCETTSLVELDGVEARRRSRLTSATRGLQRGRSPLARLDEHLLVGGARGTRRRWIWSARAGLRRRPRPRRRCFFVPTEPPSDERDGDEGEPAEDGLLLVARAPAAGARGDVVGGSVACA